MHAIQVSQATPSMYIVMGDFSEAQQLAQAEVADPMASFIIRPAPNSTIGRLIKLRVHNSYIIHIDDMHMPNFLLTGCNKIMIKNIPTSFLQF